MSSFQEIRNLLKREESVEQSQQPLPNLQLEEAKYLLALIARSDFKGQDIQIVYNTALKLQDIIKILNS